MQVIVKRKPKTGQHLRTPYNGQLSPAPPNPLPTPDGRAALAAEYARLVGLQTEAATTAAQQVLAAIAKIDERRRAAARSANTRAAAARTRVAAQTALAASGVSRTA